MPLPVNKPVTGPAAFAVPETEEIQEAFFGPAREGRLDEALTFPPGLVGNAAQMSSGRKCSTWTVAYGLLRMDLISQDEFAELVRRGDYPVMPASA